MACALAAIGLTAAGCGSDDHPNDPRPAKPIEVTARVDDDVVEVSPSEFGAGLTVFTISNQSDEAVALTLDGPVAATSQTLEPSAVSDDFKVDLQEGTYEVTGGPSRGRSRRSSWSAPRGPPHRTSCSCPSDRARPTSTARRRPVSHRRWDRDDADLPWRARSARVRRLRPAQGRRRDRGASRLLPALRELARDAGAGFVLEAPTWRASPKWASRIGYSDSELDGFNRRAIALMEELRDEYQPEGSAWVISGAIGPEGDAYSPETILDAQTRREDYHSTQIEHARRHRRGHGRRDHDDLCR